MTALPIVIIKFYWIEGFYTADLTCQRNKPVPSSLLPRVVHRHLPRSPKLRAVERHYVANTHMDFGLFE